MQNQNDYIIWASSIQPMTNSVNAFFSLYCSALALHLERSVLLSQINVGLLEEVPSQMRELLEMNIAVSEQINQDFTNKFFDLMKNFTAEALNHFDHLPFGLHALEQNYSKMNETNKNLNT